MPNRRLLRSRPARPLPRRRPLALGLAAILASPALALVVPTAASATTRTVTNCDDAGSGSLRDAIASAVSGDTLAFDLACSQITLTGGAITIDQGSDDEPLTALDIEGPGRNDLTIDGYYLDRVLAHRAGPDGSLTIAGLTMKHGFASGDGGCLLAEGDLALTDVGVEECAAIPGTSGLATRVPSGNLRVRGGGIAVGGDATLVAVSVDTNLVNGQNGYAYGAGVFAGGNLALISTTVSGNFATSDIGATYGGGVAIGDRAGQMQGMLSGTDSSIQNNGATSHCGFCPVRGGGAFVYGSTSLQDSTISGNSAFSDAHYGAGGGLYFRSGSGGAPASATLTRTDLGSNSADENGGAIGAGGDLVFTGATISGNNALSGGAIALLGGDLTLADSLLTGNIASDRGGGVFIFGYGDAAVENSTISENMAGSSGGAIANTYGSVHLSNATLTANTAATNGGAIGFRYPYYTLAAESTIIAGNTVGGNPDDIFAPGGTVEGSHNLIAAAPAVTLPGDTIGDDPMLMPLADNGGATLTHALADASPAIDAGSNPLGLAFDQRGDGFVRVSGSAADIGAFEAQPTEPADRIFASGFEP